MSETIGVIAFIVMLIGGAMIGSIVYDLTHKKTK
jgi:hypothetical protein